MRNRSNPWFSPETIGERLATVRWDPIDGTYAGGTWPGVVYELLELWKRDLVV